MMVATVYPSRNRLGVPGAPALTFALQIAREGIIPRRECRGPRVNAHENPKDR